MKRALLALGLAVLVGLVALAWVRVVFYGDFGPGDSVCLPGPSGCEGQLRVVHVPDSLIGWLVLSPRDLFVGLPLFALAIALGPLYAVLMRYEVRRRVGGEAAARVWQETGWIRRYGPILFSLGLYGLLLMWRLVAVTIASHWQQY